MSTIPCCRSCWDTAVEQIVDVPVLEFQEVMAGQIVDCTVPTIKEELGEMIQNGAK